MRLAAIAMFPLLAACAAVAPGTPPGGAGESDDARFARHADQALEETWREFPEFAFRVGRYEYADRLTVPDQANRDRSLAFHERQIRALAAFDPATLSPSKRVDLALMRNYYESRRWNLATFKAWQWQPSLYNVGDSFGRMLTTEYAPLDTRLRHMLARLEHVPAYYAAARASIHEPTLEHTRLARVQNDGALVIFNENLTMKVDGSGLLPEEKALFKARQKAARAAMSGYGVFLLNLENRLKSDGARSFRIGRELYEQKFAHDIQSRFTAEELYRMAVAEKARLHDSMEKLSREVWPRYLGTTPMPADRLDLIRAVMDELAKRHTTREGFVDAIRRQIPELEAFVREKDLVTQDPTRPLQVREMPGYMRGNAGASISPPGPYDPRANTYYNVSPLDGFSPEAAESYLRENNDWTLQLLNIHEAVPGHYTQLVHANKSPSVVKAVFGNGSMIEGWAVFGEKLMMDAGYGGGTPEMWLAWMKWNLRAVVNTILDYEIQTRGMERPAAMSLMMREAFQQQAQADEKWQRATLSQVQLTSYYNGYVEITALRDEHRARLGPRFSVKGFNDRFLSYGNAPVKLIRELMQEPD